MKNSLASVLPLTRPMCVAIWMRLRPGHARAEPQRNGDYLCPDGRYRIGDLAARSACADAPQALIGVVRRQAAAAARREELARERADRRSASSDYAAHLAPEPSAKRPAMPNSAPAALAEVAHMLDEVEQRRSRDEVTLREAEEAASVKLAATGREVEEAAADEEDARARWADADLAYPALADPADLRPCHGTRSPRRWPDTITRATETRARLDALRTRLRSAEDTHGAENEVYGMARAHRDQVDAEVQEAQRLLNQARNALQAAGLENVEARITQLQRRLKEAEEQARKTGIAKGIALHRLEAAQQERAAKAELAAAAAKHLDARNNAFGALLRAVADSLDLPANQVDDPVRYARQMTRAATAAPVSTTTCRAPSAPPSASRRASWSRRRVPGAGRHAMTASACARRQARAGASRRRAGCWMSAPRLEGTSDIRLLLNSSMSPSSSCSTPLTSV